MACVGCSAVDTEYGDILERMLLRINYIAGTTCEIKKYVNCQILMCLHSQCTGNHMICGSCMDWLRALCTRCDTNIAVCPKDGCHRYIFLGQS
jgi:hypothetical protein